MYTNYLYHHGIRNQKWGIRRFQNRDGSYTEIGKKRRRTSKLQKDSLANKSNDELRKEIERAKLEGEYKKYVSKERSKREKGESVMKTYSQAIAATAATASLALTIMSLEQKMKKG